jgi:hypothetical protein
MVPEKCTGRIAERTVTDRPGNTEGNHEIFTQYSQSPRPSDYESGIVHTQPLPFGESKSDIRRSVGILANYAYRYNPDAPPICWNVTNFRCLPGDCVWREVLIRRRPDKHESALQPLQQPRDNVL